MKLLKVNLKNKKLKRKVSVGILTYNHELFIARSLHSVLALKYENLEILISDDCSTDKTYKIVEDIVLSTKTIHTVVMNRNTVNVGLAGNFNKTFRDLATGDFLITLGGDDMIKLDYIELALKHFEEENVMLLDFNGTIVNEMDEVKGIASHLIGHRKLFSLDDYINLRPISTFAPGRMIRKELVQSFHPIAKQCPTEDSILVLRALLLGKALRLNENFIFYRRHQSNVSTPSNLMKMSHIQIILQYLKDVQYALEIGIISERQFKKLLNIINYELKRRELQYSPVNRYVKRLKLIALRLVVKMRF